MPVYMLSRNSPFPSPERAEDGLLAIGGDLSEPRLLSAYAQGIFPWYSKGEPILWWSPDPRLVLFPDEFTVTRRFERTLRAGKFHIAFDTAFPDVIRACAAIPRPGQDGTWITPEMINAYCRLHRAGYAHSVETWFDGELAGGLYGVSLGKCFFGESMFSLRPDASKTALAALVARARQWDFAFIDCQVETPHLERMGARNIPRHDFLRLLREALRHDTQRGRWAADAPPA